MRNPRASGEAGFTLVELLVAISLALILLSLSAIAFRTFWLTQGLHGAANDVRSQLRQLQQRAESESHPGQLDGSSGTTRPRATARPPGRARSTLRSR